MLVVFAPLFGSRISELPIPCVFVLFVPKAKRMNRTLSTKGSLYFQLLKNMRFGELLEWLYRGSLSLRFFQGVSAQLSDPRSSRNANRAACWCGGSTWLANRQRFKRGEPLLDQAPHQSYSFVFVLFFLLQLVFFLVSLGGKARKHGLAFGQSTCWP